ncbi:MAG: hypothetical protein NC314_04360 [Roseburia sp.]|nr:hypothetical protein [Roseburia sp.]
MPLDERYYMHFVNLFAENIKTIFNDTMINISNEYNFSYRGFFRLTYKYLPHDYKIVIENEFTAYDIITYDAEGASSVLYRVEQFDNRLDADNIRKSLILLKKILEQNNFNFYFCVNDKLYRKNAEGIKRIKDIREKLNG